MGCHRRARSAVIVLVAFALAAPPGLAPTARAADEYAYPYRDPYLATLSVGLLLSHTVRRGVDARRLSISLIPGRDKVPLMQGRGEIQAFYFRQKDPAPLLFIVPGAGSSAYNWPLRYFGERFFARGFHVIALPGTMTWNFALSASESGLPGVKEQDAKDLYRVMAAALDLIKSEYDASVTKVAFLGISMGGLDGAYLSELDAREKTIGIGRFLLINPPVDLFHSARVVDDLYDEGRGWSRDERDVLMGRVIDCALDLNRDRHILEKPSPLFDLQKLLPLSAAQLRFLIGYDLRASIGGVVYTSQQIRDRGILTSPPGQKSRRLAEAATVSVREYISEFLVPEYAERTGKPISVEELGKKSSLRSLSLGANPAVYVMHNADDFLVTAADLAYLRETLGSRFTLYPRGGHVGNLWYHDNSEAILAAFDSM